MNSGGTHATDQEIRNCILIMNNRDFYEWLRSLSEYENFRACLNITDRAIEEAFDTELVVRFIVLSMIEENKLLSINELSEFLTEELIKHAKNTEFDKETVGHAFKKTFDFLADSLRENSFRTYNGIHRKYMGAMTISLLEVVAIGLGYTVLNNHELPDKKLFVKKYHLLWKDKEFARSVGYTRASSRIPKTIAYGRSWFNK